MVRGGPGLEIRGEEHYYTYPEKSSAKGEPQTPVPDILLSSVSVVE